MSRTPLASAGIGNALTIAVDRNLVWFTEWTGNAVGFVNDSVAPTFTIGSSLTSASVAPGSSTSIPLAVSGDTSQPLWLQFADSETHAAIPVNLTVSSNVSIMTGLSGTRTVDVTIGAKPGTPAGPYLVLVTVTDGATYRSLYFRVDVR
jgi:hypothetical protein